MLATVTELTPLRTASNLRALTFESNGPKLTLSPAPASITKGQCAVHEIHVPVRTHARAALLAVRKLNDADHIATV